MVNSVTGMTTVSLAGNMHVALFWASRVQDRPKSTLPLAVMVLPLVQSHEVMGAKSMCPVEDGMLLSPSLLFGWEEGLVSKVSFNFFVSFI